MAKEVLEEALEDFRKEQEDEVAVKDAGYAPSWETAGKKLHIRMKRPPRSSKEAVSAL